MALANRDFPCGTVSASPIAIIASSESAPHDPDAGKSPRSFYLDEFMNFPGPKKSKGRMVIKRPAAKKTKAWKKTPYVRGHRDVPARGVRRDHSHWQHTMPALLKATDMNIVKKPSGCEDAVAKE